MQARCGTSPCTATSCSCSSRRRAGLRELLRRGAGARSTTWSTARRSAGCTVAGGVLRNIIHCNWKMYLENINDTVHPLSTHESATQAAQTRSGRASRPMRPSRWRWSRSCRSAPATTSSTRWAVASTPNGHSVLGTQLQHPFGLRPAARVRGGDARGPRRRARRRDPAALAAERGAAIPSLAVKGSPQAIRVIRPLAADRTLVEAWSFRVERRARAAVRARDELQPARVLADVGGRARRRAPVREHPAGPARRGQRMGQPAPRLRRRRARRRRRATPTAPTNC